MIHQHSGEFLTGEWFSSYPTFASYEQGKPFKFQVVNSRFAYGSIGNANLEHTNNQMTIKTTYSLPFKPRTYVLYKDILFIIAEISAEEISGQAQALIKNGLRRYSMILTQVDNGKEDER